MPSTASIQIQNQQLQIKGILDCMTVTALYEQSLALLQNETIRHIDFSQVESANSAALALIVEWVKWANTHHRSLSFLHIPDNLLAIAKVADVEGLLHS